MRPRTVLPVIGLAIVVGVATIATARGADTRDARLTGISLFETGRFADAIPYFDQVIARHGRDIDILNKRGICHLRTEQPGKALADFDRIIEHSTRFARSFGRGPIYSPLQTWLPQPASPSVFPQAHGNRGSALLMLGRNEEALQSFTTAVNLWNAPDFGFAIDSQATQAMIARGRAEAYQGLGQSYHRLGQDEQAVQAYSQAISINPSDPNGYAGRGDCLTSLRLLNQAVADYTEAIRLDSTHSRAHAGRGTALADQKRFAAALTDFDRAIALDPRFARAYSFRGALHAQMGRNQLALADYDTLIGLMPDDACAYKDRGGMYVRLGRFDAALKDLNESIRLDPKLGKAYLNRGAAYNGLTQYEKAIDDLSEAIRLDPENAGAFTNRGLACFGAGRYDQAIVDLSEAIQLAPRTAIPYFNRAEVFARLGVRERALADYNEALRLEPGLTAAQTALAHLRDENKRLSSAIPDIDMTLQLDSKEIRLLEERGNDLRDKGDWLGALAEYNRAVTLDPRRAELYVARGWSRLSAGVDGSDFDARAYLALKGWRDGLAPYMAVLAVLGARAGGRPQQAQLVLDEALVNLPPRVWPVPILRFLKGDMTAAALLAAATGDRQQNEARLILGLDRLQGGDRAAGLPQLQWVSDHDAPGSITGDVARATLARVAPTTR